MLQRTVFVRLERILRALAADIFLSSLHLGAVSLVVVYSHLHAIL